MRCARTRRSRSRRPSAGPSRYSRAAHVLVPTPIGDDAHLAAIFELKRHQRSPAGGRGLLPGIGPDELVFAAPPRVNAAFCHFHPLGSLRRAGSRRAGTPTSRSNGARRGGLPQVSRARRDSMPDESITYDDYQADSPARLHDLREAAGEPCLSPTSYASRTLAARLPGRARSASIIPASARRRHLPGVLPPRSRRAHGAPAPGASREGGDGPRSGRSRRGT